MTDLERFLNEIAVVAPNSIKIMNQGEDNETKSKSDSMSKEKSIRETS